MANYTKLTDLFTGIANSIRNKTGSSSAIVADNFPTAISGITTVSEGTSDATATASQILTGQTAYVNGSKITGSMANQGAKTSSLNCGSSYTIPAGYHNGSGKVTANSLASQTSATATASDILSGKTAYVNGGKITGSMSNNGAISSSLNCGGSYTVPAGYTSGGTITANSLASQTSATATASNIESGKTAWVNGSMITGTRTIPNYTCEHGRIAQILSMGTKTIYTTNPKKNVFKFYGTGGNGESGAISVFSESMNFILDSNGGVTTSNISVTRNSNNVVITGLYSYDSDYNIWNRPFRYIIFDSN